MADRAVGGFSTASLDYEPAEPSTNTPSHARFHGSISTKLPDNWRVERTGMFCLLDIEVATESLHPYPKWRRTRNTMRKKRN